MKKIKNIVLVFINICLIIISVTTIFAWYTNSKKIPSIDANSDGIKFVYKVNQETEINPKEYNVNNIAFYDVESTYELDDFLASVTKIEISLVNTGDLDFNYSISQTVLDKTKPYIACLFSKGDLIVKKEDTKIEDLFLSNGSITGNIEGRLNTSESIFVYIFGIQPDKKASNDFLSQKYRFEIAINIFQ